MKTSLSYTEKVLVLLHSLSKNSGKSLPPFGTQVLSSLILLRLFIVKEGATSMICHALYFIFYTVCSLVS